jgi:hypothetical protein
MRGMSESPKQRRLQFSTRHLLALTAIVAAGTAYTSYKFPGRPLFAATSGIAGGLAGIGAMTIVGVACLFPERYGRWLRPLAVVISGVLAMAFGLWMRKNL